MKLFCDVCEQLVPLTAPRSEAGAWVFVCPRCGAEAALSTEGPALAGQPTDSAPPEARAPKAPASAAAERAPQLSLVPGGEDVPFSFEPPATFCPKCVEPREEAALTCGRCGLVFANFLPEAVAPPPELAEQWRALLTRWEDASAHEQLVLQASRLGALPQLARLYRIRLAQRSGDARARAGCERIVGLAASTPLVKTPIPALDRQRIRALQYALFAVAVLALLGLLFKWVVR